MNRMSLVCTQTRKIHTCALGIPNKENPIQKLLSKSE